jgi:hypothetical protein
MRLVVTLRPNMPKAKMSGHNTLVEKERQFKGLKST